MTSKCYYCKETGADPQNGYHNECKAKMWGTPQHWGTLTIRYKPTGETQELKLGIRRMGYANELIFCEAWGYDEGHARPLNNPDNWEVLDVKQN